jgi:hypothetical protein
MERVCQAFRPVGHFRTGTSWRPSKPVYRAVGASRFGAAAASAMGWHDIFRIEPKRWAALATFSTWTRMRP